MSAKIQSGSLGIFADHLQAYYPAKRDGEEVYVKTETLTATEVEKNAKYIEKCADALLRQADALRAWHVSRR